jgi:hypothetical protein
MPFRDAAAGAVAYDPLMLSQRLQHPCPARLHAAQSGVRDTTRFRGQRDHRSRARRKNRPGASGARLYRTGMPLLRLFHSPPFGRRGHLLHCRVRPGYGCVQ